ncbi:CASP-like protein [Arachis hypogaea]|nr:CASP-like protein [Arachis hypogaea]
MLGRDLNQRSPVKMFWRFNFRKIKKIGFRMCCCGKKTSAFMIFGRNLTILVVAIDDLWRRLCALNLPHFVGKKIENICAFSKCSDLIESQEWFGIIYWYLYLFSGVSPRTVPAYHSTNLKLFDKRIKIAELVLRFMILGLGVVAAALIRTDSQVKVFFSFEKEAKFTDVKTLVFLVVANGLAAGYSLIQGLRCVVSLIRGSVLFNKPLAWAIFSADQVGLVLMKSFGWCLLKVM